MSDVIVGTGLVTENVNPEVVPPPGAGFVTVTDTDPMDVRFDAAIVAVTCEAETNVVVSGVPSQFTTESALKFPPFTVNKNCEEYAVALFGERDEIVGTGFVTINVVDEDVPPPGAGFTTVIVVVAADVTFAAGTIAVICVDVTYVVVNDVPFQFTVELGTKFVPFTVNVNCDAPLCVLVGETDVNVGAGLLIENVVELDVPPPGVGEKTETSAFPAVPKFVEEAENVTFVDETYVVVCDVPFHFTTEPEIKFKP